MSTEDLIAYIVVFVIAMIENIAAIPIGLFIGLDPVAVLITASAGALTMMVVALLVGDRIGRWVMKDADRAARMDSMRERTRAKLDKYGAPALAVPGPLVAGVHVGTVLAGLMGIPKRKIAIWMSLGIIGVAIGVTVLTTTLGNIF